MAIVYVGSPQPLAGLGRIRLKRLRKKLKKVAKKVVNVHKKVVRTLVPKPVREIAKKALPVAAVVAPFIPVLAPAAAALRAAVTAQQLAAQRQDFKEAERAEKEAARQRGEMIDSLAANGVPQDQAARIVDMIAAGVDPESAMRAVLSGSAPAPVTVALPPHDRMFHQVAPAPVPVAKPEVVIMTTQAATAPTVSDDSRLAFIEWLQRWNPEFYSRLAVEAPDVLTVSPPGVAGIDWDTGEYLAGLGEFDLSAFVDKIASAGSKLLGTYYDRQVLKAQLDRIRSGLPVAPTTLLQQQAAQQTLAAGQPLPAGVPPPFGLSMPLMLGLAGLAVAGFVFFSRRR